MTDFGLKVIDNFLRAEAVDQFNNFKTETIAKVDDYERSLDPTQDTKDWEKNFSGLLTQRSQALSKLSNAQARRNAESWLSAQGVEWKNRVYWSGRKAKTDQMQASAEANINFDVKRAIEATDDKTYADSIESLRDEIYSRTTIDEKGDINLWSKQEADLLFQKYIKDIETKRPLWVYQQVENEVVADPQAVLDRIKNGKLQGRPELDESQVQAIEYYAESIKKNRAYRAEQLADSQVQAIHQLAIKDVPIEEVRAKIDQSDGLTPLQKTEAWKQYNAAMSVRAKTGQNPYTTTQDWNAAMEAYWKAEQGIAPDRKDVGSKYDVQWYEKIKKIAEGGGTASDFEDSKAAKFLADMLTNDKTAISDEIFAVVKEKGYRLLQEAIQAFSAAGRPLTDREKKEKALEIYNNLKSEVAEGNFKKLTPESMKTSAEIETGNQQLYAEQRQYQPTREEFLKRVAQLKAQGSESAARKYYDRWSSLFK